MTRAKNWNRLAGMSSGQGKEGPFQCVALGEAGLDLRSQ